MINVVNPFMNNMSLKITESQIKLTSDTHLTQFPLKENKMNL